MISASQTLPFTLTQYGNELRVADHGFIHGRVLTRCDGPLLDQIAAQLRREFSSQALQPTKTGLEKLQMFVTRVFLVIFLFL